MDDLRVLHLTTEYPPVIYGGLGTAVGGWVAASAKSGMTMGVLLVEGELVVNGEPANVYGAPRPGRAAHPATIEVEGGEQAVVDRLGVRFFQATWSTAVEIGLRLVRRWQPDIIHLHTAMVWPVAQAIHEQLGTPLVYHVHSVDRAEYEIGAEPSPWLAHNQPQEDAIAVADRLIALSHDERDLLAQYYPDVASRIRIVGNGIDDDIPCRKRFPANPETPLTILYSGRLVERKGIREFLDAIPRVLDVAPHTRFVLAGGPPPLSGNEVARQWLTAELEPYADRIHFTGWLTPSALTTWYQRADIQVVPSRYEPFGMVILEGMLHGLPIVASDVGGPAEILAHGRTGLLFPPRDVDALAHALISLVTDRPLCARLGAAAADEVRRHWTWPRRVTSMRATYDELVPGCRAALHTAA
jgi:glycogen(starch) synthase